MAKPLNYEWRFERLNTLGARPSFSFARSQRSFLPNYNLFVSVRNGPLATLVATENILPVRDLLWFRPAGCGLGATRQQVAVDGGGNYFVLGQFFGAAKFGNTTLTSSSGYSLFLAKYDRTGNCVSVRQLSGN